MNNRYEEVKNEHKVVMALVMECVEDGRLADIRFEQ